MSSIPVFAEFDILRILGGYLSLLLSAGVYELSVFLISLFLGYETASLVWKASRTSAYAPAALIGVGVPLCFYFGAESDSVLPRYGLLALILFSIPGGLYGARLATRRLRNLNEKGNAAAEEIK